MPNATATAESALPRRLRHHAETLHPGPPDTIHRLDDLPVRQPRVRLQVEHLVGAILEDAAELGLEAAGRDRSIVQVEPAVLCEREDDAFLHGGRFAAALRE